VLGTLCLLLGLFVSQELAYSGSLPGGTRYDFPAMLIPICFVYFIACVVNLRVREAGKQRSADGWALGFGLAIAIVFLSTGGIRGLAGSIDKVETNIVKTREFSDELAAIVLRARTDPAAPIILEAYGPGAYEPVYSLSAICSPPGWKTRSLFDCTRTANRSVLFTTSWKTDSVACRIAEEKSFVKLVDLPGRGPCLSIGINGEADTRCSEFRIRTP